MKVQTEDVLAEFSSDEDSLITVGVFDGVHIGHRNLVDTLKMLAKQQGLLSVVITFNQHPQEILSPETTPPFLTDSREKVSLLKDLGVDIVIILDFTKDLSQLSAKEFASVLKKRLRMRGLVVGPDFSMGRNSKGNITALQELGRQMGFSVTPIPPVTQNGDIVSSTAIRNALAAGDMEKVGRFMGRPFTLHGKVLRGKGRGKDLGAPTVNLGILPGQAVPADGVYATRVHIDDTTYPSVTNVGENPTFGENERTIESFLLDFHDDLYGREVRVEFVHRIRSEIKFASAEELKTQIVRDISEARSILAKIT